MIDKKRMRRTKVIDVCVLNNTLQATRLIDSPVGFQLPPINS